MYSYPWRNWDPCTLLVGTQNGAVSTENSVTVPREIKIALTYGPASPLLGVYQEESKATCQRDVRARTSPAAVFTAGRKWKPPECPRVDTWINKINKARVCELSLQKEENS